MRLALISKSRVAGLFVPLGPPPGLILTVGHVGCNRRCANLAVNAFLVPPQLYTVGIDINVKIADMASVAHAHANASEYLALRVIILQETVHDSYLNASDKRPGTLLEQIVNEIVTMTGKVRGISQQGGH